jgi:hypothetical protein
MEGPPRSYFNIMSCSEPAHATVLTYVELKEKVRGRLSENEDFLCDWVDKAIGFPTDAGEWNRGACLFWRLSSKIEVDEQETTLDTVKLFVGYREHENPTPEEIFERSRKIGDNHTPDDLGWWSKIYTRLVIPGRNLREWAAEERVKSRELVRP